MELRRLSSVWVIVGSKNKEIFKINVLQKFTLHALFPPTDSMADDSMSSCDRCIEPEKNFCIQLPTSLANEVIQAVIGPDIPKAQTF